MQPAPTTTRRVSEAACRNLTCKTEKSTGCSRGRGRESIDTGHEHKASIRICRTWHSVRRLAGESRGADAFRTSTEYLSLPAPFLLQSLRVMPTMTTATGRFPTFQTAKTRTRPRTASRTTPAVVHHPRQLLRQQALGRRARAATPNSFSKMTNARARAKACSLSLKRMTRLQTRMTGRRCILCRRPACKTSEWSGGKFELGS